jgi:hypothetical protein
MYRKYLLKKNFWRSNNAYVKHDLRAGGIYAYVQPSGVKIVTSNETRFFNNFDELDLFLDKLCLSTSRNESNQFMQVLNRRNTSKTLRQFPLS